MSAPYTKLKNPVSELAIVCRGCLAESGEMKNIWEWGLFEDFFKFTNIMLNKSDGLSELICTSCEETLMKCKTFQQQCQKVDTYLKDALSLKKKTNESSQKSHNDFNENKVSCILDNNKLLIKVVAPDTQSRIYFSCPFNQFRQCEDNFTKKRYLMIHLTKVHEIKESEFSIELKYFCSYPSCSYYVNSETGKYFTERKFLNQHVIKVHKPKTVSCFDCSFTCATLTELNRHFEVCNKVFSCQLCNAEYKNNERLLVHMKRKHPEIHEEYKNRKKKRIETVTDPRKLKDLDDFCYSPKRSFATQTNKIEDNIKNDVALPPWQAKTDEISTQTVFANSSEDEALYSETVYLNDIQTQTFPVEFGLSRSNKETSTSESQPPDLSIKETQTCFCLYDYPKTSFKIDDSVAGSPSSVSLTSTETQTVNHKSDVLLSFSSAETQTSDECLNF